MISAAHLTRQFGPRAAVSDVSFEIARGEIVALLGPNGAGKTTTLRMLAGLIAPTTGSVAIDGVPMTRRSGAELRRRIGFLTEAPGLWDRLTVRENLTIYARLYRLAAPLSAVDAMLTMLEIADRASTRAAELSKGMRQKVALARALLHDPAVLLLDEPTSGLDPEIARTVRRLLADRRAAGCAVLVSTHNLDEAERMADRIAVLNTRLVALDTSATLRRRLTQGRLVVRLADTATRYVEAARAFDPDASANASTLTLAIRDANERTPDLVAALVAAGARVVEVRQETPALEDVYLHLVSKR